MHRRPREKGWSHRVLSNKNRISVHDKYQHIKKTDMPWKRSKMLVDRLVDIFSNNKVASPAITNDRWQNKRGVKKRRTDSSCQALAASDRDYNEPCQKSFCGVEVQGPTLRDDHTSQPHIPTPMHFFRSAHSTQNQSPNTSCPSSPIALESPWVRQPGYGS